MKVIVQKYGGTSVATTEKIKTVAKRVKERVDSGYKIVIVLSAMGKTTDKLIELAHEISNNPSSREMDMLMSTGEQVTIALFSMASHELGLSAISLTGKQAGFLADSVHRKAKITDIKTDRLKKEVENNDVVVVAGFQGVDQEDNIVTLGRGGSDLSAVALAAALNVEKCEIYTDVAGVYTADPRVEKNAKKLDSISFDEMLELASSGAGVMQARSIEVAKKYNIPIVVRLNTGEGEGTIIKEEDESMENVIIRGIAHDKSEAKVTLKKVPDQPGIAAEIFEAIANAEINVDMIVQNIGFGEFTDLSFTIPADDSKKVESIVKEITTRIGSGEIDIDQNIGKISVVGIGMKSHTGVAAKMFKLLANNNINIHMISTSEIKISCVVSSENLEKAVQVLHEGFELNK